MTFAYLLVFFLGAILPFAFAPFNIYTLSFIAPSILLYQWQKATPKQAFFQGYLFGLSFFGVGVSWVYISIHNYGNASLFVAGLITFAMIAILALFIAVNGYLLTKFYRKQNKLIFCLAAFPATWVIFEWLRSLLLNGFPWLYLGYAQLTTPLRGYAPIFGVYGVSLATTAICGCLVLICTRQKMKYKITSVSLAFFLLALGWGLTGKHWTKPSGEPLNLSLVQANISQSIKWKPGVFEEILQKYQSLTQPHEDNRLIIWPEAALPVFSQQIPQVLSQLNEQAKQQKSTLLVGILLGDLNTKQYYNGIVLLGADQGEYRKRHLVPFGEYTPLASVFSFLIHYWQIPMSNFSEGPAKQSILQVGPIKIAPFICYEIAYPLQVLKYSQDSNLIVNISDDSWFGKSTASAQQAQMARFRALEMGRYTLLSANTGITGIVDPLGNLTKVLPPHQEGVLTGAVTPMTGKTPLMSFNYYPLLAIIIILLLLGVIQKFSK